MKSKGFMNIQLFGGITTRSNAESLISEQVASEIVQGIVSKSAVLSQFKKLPNMTSDKTSMRVLDLLPLAYFVNGDTGTKQVTKMAWDKKTIHAEEIAVIVPIAEAVLNDADYDIWGEVKPRIIEAFGKKIDGAVLFGVDKPTSWRADLVSSIRNAGNGVTATASLFDDIMGEDGILAKVEDGGFNPNGAISGIQFKSKLRGLKDDNNRPLFMSTMQGSTPYGLDGNPIHFIDNGSWNKAKAQLVIGDFTQAVYSIRQDVTYKLLDQAVIQDPSTGEILYNLAQQDMVALRVVMRLGWEVPNPINALDPSEVTRFPFSLLEPSSTATTYDVTFTVTDTEESAVEGAKVTLGGMVKNTDSSGEAVFKVPANTNANYTVKKTGAVTQSGTAEVSESDIAVTISNFG